MRRLLVASLGLALATAACVPPPPEQTLAKSYPETTTMGTLQESGTVTIGITSKDPPLAYVDPSTEAPAGFGTALGRVIANTLGVRARFVATSSGELLQRVDAGTVDVAFPNLPLTEDSLREHPFSTPYLITHERVLVRKRSGVTALEDLAGARVCAAIDPATQVRPQALEASLRVVSGDVRGCLTRMRRRAVDAVVAGDVWLGWIKAQLADDVPTKIVGDQLSTAGYGAAVTVGGGWLPFVNSVLTTAEADGTWADLYERWIGPAPEPPDLSAEEAAALWPSQSPQ